MLLYLGLRNAPILHLPSSPCEISEQTPSFGRLQEVLGSRPAVVGSPDFAPLPPSSSLPEHQVATTRPGKTTTAASPRKNKHTPVQRLSQPDISKGTQDWEAPKLTDPTSAPENSGSEDLVVIYRLLRDLSVRKECNVLSFLI